MEAQKLRVAVCLVGLVTAARAGRRMALLVLPRLNGVTAALVDVVATGQEWRRECMVVVIAMNYVVWQVDGRGDGGDIWAAFLVDEWR